MREITLEELLEAGCHFGHQVTRQNPKARDYIFEARDNIHIIDLAKTKEGLDEAAVFVKSLASKEGSTLLIVATKRQAQPIVLEELKRVSSDGLYYVTNRWIGGILTNLSEILKNFKKLKDLTEKLRNEEEKAKYTKKEVGLWEKERLKLENLYAGVSTMQRPPDALFIVDTHLEDLAVREAQKTNIITVGITDTNADPTIIDYAIPANDDAVGSIKLIVGYILDAWAEGRKKSKEAEVSKGKTTKKVEEVEKVEKVRKKRARPKKVA